ncbi:MAG: flagellar motor switch protein FliM [Anaerolineae bacterium]|nr:flagellar motor switch protein FliM [Anaerolineae bacterium]
MERDKKSLSQKEIDALLSILPNEEASRPGADRFIGSAKTYDFRSPDKFSKEQIRTLQMIHENFTRRVSSSLAAYLRAAVQLSCVHIEQGSFADFIQNIPTSSLAAVLKMDPLPGRILLTLDASTIAVAVDRMLGGFGRPITQGHQITDIEQSLVQGVIQYLATELREAWRNVITLNINIEETTLNPEFVQVALPTDAAVFLGFEFKVRENNGSMSICIPYSVLKPIVSELSPHTWVTGENEQAGNHQKGLFSHLKQTQVDLSVLLGEITVDFEELLHLQIGNVLPLDTIVNRPLPVLVGNSKKYIGQPGLSGSYMAIQITAVVEDIS